MSDTAKFQKIKDALRYTLINYENTNGRKGLRVKRGDALKAITRRLVHMAINGQDGVSLAAIKELTDRMDGKAVQSLVGDNSQPITIVERVIVQQPQQIDKDSSVVIEHDKQKHLETIN